MTFQDNFVPKHGAGCMVMARHSGRFLLSLRPADEDEGIGGTWSLWGGKAEPNETPKETALREVFEETGVHLTGEVFHLKHKEMGRFSYETYLMVVEDEFEPAKTVESAGFKWATLDDLPKPLHWGVVDLLSDRTAVNILTKSVENMSGRPCPFDAVYIP